MRKVIYPEYLGKIKGEALLEELAKINNIPITALDKLRLTYPNGFAVTGEFEWDVYESAESQQLLRDLVSGRKNSDPMFGAPYPPGKKLLRLILEVAE